MYSKTIIPLFFLFFHSFYAQENCPILHEKDFIGHWEMKKNSEDLSKFYMKRITEIKNFKGYRVNFFKGKFTGKMRVQTFSTKSYKSRCGNQAETIHNDFGYHQIWHYDKENQVLQVLDPNRFKTIEYTVECSNSSEIVLTRIK